MNDTFYLYITLKKLLWYVLPNKERICKWKFLNPECFYAQLITNCGFVKLFWIQKSNKINFIYLCKRISHGKTCIGKMHTFKSHSSILCKHWQRHVIQISTINGTNLKWKKHDSNWYFEICIQFVTFNDVILLWNWPYLFFFKKNPKHIHAMSNISETVLFDNIGYQQLTMTNCILILTGKLSNWRLLIILKYIWNYVYCFPEILILLKNTNYF